MCRVLCSQCAEYYSSIFILNAVPRDRCCYHPHFTKGVGSGQMRLWAGKQLAKVHKLSYRDRI